MIRLDALPSVFATDEDITRVIKTALAVANEISDRGLRAAFLNELLTLWESRCAAVVAWSRDPESTPAPARPIATAVQCGRVVATVSAWIRQMEVEIRCELDEFERRSA